MPAACDVRTELYCMQMNRNAEEILARVREAGFTMSASRELVLSEELARQFYSEQADKPYFEELVRHMTR